jgi:hypothetical protein
MEVVKEYMLIINSANRNSGTSSNFTIDIPHEINISVDKEQHQLLKLTLLKFSTYLDFYNIGPGKDTIIFRKYNGSTLVQTETKTIPQGNYKFSTLASLLTNTACIVTYQSTLNKFQFNFGTSTGTVQCVDNSFRVFGFSDTLEKGGTSTFYSETSIKPRYFDRLNIYLSNVIVLAENFENNLTKVSATGATLPGKYLSKSKLLASMEINNAPFTLLTYDGSLDNYGLYLDDKRLKRLTFKITNEFNEEFVEMTDAHMVLKLQLLEDDHKVNNDILKELQVMNEYMRLSFLAKNIK